MHNGRAETTPPAVTDMAVIVKYVEKKPTVFLAIIGNDDHDFRELYGRTAN